MTTRERRENRADRRRSWQQSRQVKHAAAVKAADAARDALPPMGEPIKIGHHSEKHHRKAIERAHTTMEKVVEHADMERHHSDAADAIEHELDRSIYSDDDDACERLRERIAELEAERARMKAVNAWITKALRGGPVKRRHVSIGAPEAQYEAARAAILGARDALDLTPAELRALVDALQFSQTVGYPPYALSNIGGNLSRQRARLAKLS